MAADQSASSEAILASELAINERWSKGGVDGALEANAEDVTYFDSLVERLQRRPRGGDFNLVNFTADGQGGEKPATAWSSTQVYQLIDEKWRVDHVHWPLTRHSTSLQGIMS